VFHELRSKHADDYTGPQYRIWSCMFVNKIHESLEEPPNIPIITGEVPRGKKREPAPLMLSLKLSLELLQQLRSI